MDDSAIADNCDRPVPPDGRWRAIGNAGSFTDHCGTFYWRDAELEEPGDARFGFRVEQHHCNLRPTGHGGLLAMVADVFMARGALLVDGVATPLPTISLTIDYLAPAPLGAWIEAEVVVTRATRALAFVRTMLFDGDVPLLQASAVFRHSGARGAAETQAKGS